MTLMNSPVLTFNLGDQVYALLISDVVEVASMIELTLVADTLPEILGVANWHGTVLPMVDLRRVFGQPVNPITASSVFIVGQTERSDKIGLVVDTLNQVEYLDLERLTESHGAGKFIRGIISAKERLIQLVALAPLAATYLSGVVA